MSYYEMCFLLTFYLAFYRNRRNSLKTKCDRVGYILRKKQIVSKIVFTSSGPNFRRSIVPNSLLVQWQNYWMLIS